MAYKKLIYEKPVASVVFFDNSDVVTSSLGGVKCYSTSLIGCEAWSSDNGRECHGNLHLTGSGLLPPLN